MEASNEPPRPVLDLSGTKLKMTLESVVSGCEARGGIERYVEALKLKATLFQDVLADARLAALEADDLMGLCTFMATVRRRIAPYLTDEGCTNIRAAIVELFDGRQDTSTTDARIAAFCGRFPSDKGHRWVRDLAAELLHHAEPERYPLMTRWIWDARANTGVLREIWFGDDVDSRSIAIEDNYATFLMLREELAQFLSDNGFFRDVMFYIDLLCAQAYAEYICEQGGTYLRADFSSPEDPMVHTRRMLGLDGVKRGSGKTRLKSSDGTAYVVDDTPLLS